MPHDKVLVIKLSIFKCLVNRVPIYNDNFTDIIFLSTLREMSFDERKVKKVTINLVSFNGELNAVIGKVIMPTIVGGVTIYSTMIVAKVNLAYNVILC